MLPAIQLSQVSDPATQQALRLITQPINQILGIALLDGLSIQSVVLKANTELSIPHKLARKYVGYFLTNKNANANIWTSSSSENDIYLKLTASADVTVDIWVY